MTQSAREVFLILVRFGDPDRVAARLAGAKLSEFRELAKKDKEFADSWNEAKTQQSGSLACAIRETMSARIAAGDVWFVKLAILNYNTGLRDPDFVLKKELQKKPEEKKRDENITEFRVIEKQTGT